MLSAPFAALVFAAAPPALLAPTSAVGDTWVIATASGQTTDSEGFTLTLPMLLGGPFESTAECAGRPNNAHASLEAALTRQGLGWQLAVTGSAGSTAPTGQHSFGRADINVMIEFSLGRSSRVQLDWDMLATGIANGLFKLQRLPVQNGATVVEEVVSSYIFPDASTGTSLLQLQAGNYRLQYYGTVQANSSFENPDEGGYTATIDLVSLDATDLNGDGAVNGADLGMLLAAWNTPDADLSGDGTTDGADLGLLLAAWEV